VKSAFDPERVLNPGVKGPTAGQEPIADVSTIRGFRAARRREEGSISLRPSEPMRTSRPSPSTRANSLPRP
jgi:hypothetical protein